MVIAKQQCFCALKEFQNKRFEKGLDPPQWMQIVNVNLLKTETSWATRVSIAGRRQAIDLVICAVHLGDLPAEPDETAREHFHRTIAKAVSGSAWIPPQVFGDELQLCSIFECEALQWAIWLRILLLCRLIQLRGSD